MSKMKIKRGSGDILQDLGASPAEAAKQRLRYTLAIEIEETVRRRGWTQVVAAKKLGISQSRVSYLLTGKIEKFTLDALVVIFSRLGGKVDIRKRPPKTGVAA